MMKTFLYSPALSLALAVLPLTVGTSHAARAAEPAARVAITFETGEPNGAMMVALFDSEAAYKANRPVDSARADVSGVTTTVTFTGVKPGRYAVLSFQDLDGDGKMGRNPFGMPTEPYGFSNNAPPHMGPPEWSKAAFEVTAAGASQRITLR
ncbi:MAG TPA: DUF2141 domain-containing protein [Caulobacteraceae bacterium]|jgi:uncharacterized protein (DUF2141 family)